MAQAQRYLVEVTASSFNSRALATMLEKVIRENVSDWLDYNQDVAVKVTLDQP
jgi:hypothetical protein